MYQKHISSLQKALKLINAIKLPKEDNGAATYKAEASRNVSNLISGLTWLDNHPPEKPAKKKTTKKTSKKK